MNNKFNKINGFDTVKGIDMIEYKTLIVINNGGFIPYLLFGVQRYICIGYIIYFGNFELKYKSFGESLNVPINIQYVDSTSFKILFSDNYANILLMSRAYFKIEKSQ